MFKRSLVFFPGFLGKESDWDDFISLFTEDFWQETQCVFMDYFSRKSSLSPLNTWKELNQYISDQIQSNRLHFIGYSMGGRLALKLKSERTGPVSSMTLLSSHPGISKDHYLEENVDSLILERKNWDNIWADKFSRTSIFEQALKDWAQLAIFNYDKPLDRRPLDYNNDKLALAFKKWSPAQIIIPKEQLEGHNWVCGQEDTKYTELYKKMEKSVAGSFKYINNVGHRTLFYPEHWAKSVIEKIISSEN